MCGTDRRALHATRVGGTYVAPSGYPPVYRPLGSVQAFMPLVCRLVDSEPGAEKPRGLAVTDL